MKTERISGTISAEEKEAWWAAMERDGFNSLWTWVTWIVRKHIRAREKEDAQ